MIATGETIEEVYAYSEEMNEQSSQQIFVLMILFSGLFILTSGFMINGLGKQSENFRKTLVKQAEVYEDIYTAMSVGLLRIRMTEDETSVLQINPKGLKTLGVETEEDIKLMQEIGVYVAQGYYYFKPIPEADFEEKLDNERVITEENME